MIDLVSMEQRAKELLKNTYDLGLSIDLETPSSRGTGIFSVGIVPFSEERNEVYEELALYVRFDFTQVIDAGDFSAGTLRWWMMQDSAARMEIIHTEVVQTEVANRKSEKCLERMDYKDGLQLVLDYCHMLKKSARIDANLYPLGNGKEFDVRILEDTWIKHGLIPQNWKAEYEFPWKFWDALDLRERVKDVRLATGEKVKNLVQREGTHHNAVDDALYQARVYVKGAQLLDEARTLYKKSKEESK